MARKRRTNSGSTSNSMPIARRRSTLRDLQAAVTSDSDVIVPKVINAAPSLEKAEMYGIDDERPTSKRMMAWAGRLFIETIPQWLAVGGMLALIFGGCCSNVGDPFLGALRHCKGAYYQTGVCSRSHCKVSHGHFTATPSNSTDISLRVEPDSGKMIHFAHVYHSLT
jgi:hypothetical protein